MNQDMSSVMQIADEKEENEPDVEYDISVYPSDFTIWEIYQKFHYKEIKIPEFQRKFVWDKKQASKLIESFLLGLPVPAVFFYSDEAENKMVIDGQQRITSIHHFFQGKWQDGRKFRLTGLNENSRWNKKTFSELESADQRKLKNQVLRALNVQQNSPKKDDTSIYHIFERLNTGGKALNAQEVRNCVYQGDLSRKLAELNKDHDWRQILGKTEPDKRQKDIELLLRLFALSKWSGENYKAPLKEFLNRVMAIHKDGKTDGWQKFCSLFSECCQKIIGALGEKPFCKHGSNLLNASVMDAVFCNLISEENEYGNPNTFRENYEKFRQQPDFSSVIKKPHIERLDIAKKQLWAVQGII